MYLCMTMTNNQNRHNPIHRPSKWFWLTMATPPFMPQRKFITESWEDWPVNLAFG